MKKYDIGILSLWNVPNYGTFAQEYALQKVLSEISKKECVQIAHLDEVHYDFYYNFNKYLRMHGQILSKLYLKNLLFTNKKKQRLQLFSKAYDTIPHTDCISRDNVGDYNFEKIIIGSDILWDYSLEPFNKDPLLFGHGFQGKIFSYAASFGTVKANDDIPSYVIDGINKMEMISVRDNNSADIVKKITGEYPQIVLDPTYLWNFNEDNNVIDPVYNNYILVYGQDFSNEYINNLVKFAKFKNKKIIALDCNNDQYSWCDVLIKQSELTPFEWFGYFKNADYVATSTFHGVTFGLIFNKKIAFSKTDFIMAKFENFLRELNLISVFDDKNDVEKMFTYEWDYENINKIIELKKLQSLDYLKLVVGCDK